MKTKRMINFQHMLTVTYKNRNSKVQIIKCRDHELILIKVDLMSSSEGPMRYAVIPHLFMARRCETLLQVLDFFAEYDGEKINNFNPNNINLLELETDKCPTPTSPLTNYPMMVRSLT